jgi:hypothetical protein
MAPTVHSAKLTLSCPLFAADFDPRDNGRLLVGGGGGEGRSGVENKIVRPSHLLKKAWPCVQMLILIISIVFDRHLASQ